MKLSVIHRIVETYQKQMGKLDPLGEALYEYPLNWAEAKANGASTVDILMKTFKSKRTQRLWKKERYRPLENLAAFHDESPEWVEETLAMLDQPSRPIEDQIDSFQSMRDELIRQFKKSKPHSIIADAHWDIQWISLLLSASRPTKFPFYHQKLFFRGTEALAMRPLPSVDDYGRYCKMIDILFKFMEDKGLATQRAKQIQSLYGTVAKEDRFKNTAVEALALYLQVDIFS